MKLRPSGRIAAAAVLLLCLAPLGAFAQFEIISAGLRRNGLRFQLRGVAYSSTPIGALGSNALADADCRYARDFPLIAAMGANTIRTRARVDPADRGFYRTLDSAGLYWLADFPLDDYQDPTASLSPETPEGAALRERVRSDFVDWVARIASQPRLLAVAFGSEVARDYASKFAGDPRHFYTLLAEAAAALQAAGFGDLLLTSSVHDASQLGAFALASSDAQQPLLDFWSLDAAGKASLSGPLQTARSRSGKPILISGFGIDAYDGLSGSGDNATQAAFAGTQAAELSFAADRDQALGGIWNGFVDEWALGGVSPSVHGATSRAEPDSPDAEYHPAWAGLFSPVRTGVEGLDTLRPRPAYSTLTAAWKGALPAALYIPGRPQFNENGVEGLGGQLAVVARGGLLRVRGGGLAAGPLETPSGADLPLHLGPTSACVGGRAVPLFFADGQEIRGQVAWETETGPAQAIVYRAGVASNPLALEIVDAAPAILPGAIFRPGLPCPVDEENGVRPGAYLEVYGSGLGAALSALPTGLAAQQAEPIAQWPGARLNEAEIPVVYSGMFPAVVGVYQTNIQVPPDYAAGLADLRLTLDGALSNAQRLSVVDRDAPATLSLSQADPPTLVIQAGAAAGAALFRIGGRGGFCNLVRFQVGGLPPGVRASIPVGFPGQTLPLALAADPGAPRVEEALVTLTAISAGSPPVQRSLLLTVLPAGGDIRLRVVSGGWLSQAPVASFEFDGRLLFEVHGGGSGRGHSFLTIDPETGALGASHTFDTWASAGEVAALEAYLESLPAGTLVLGAVADDGFYNLTDRTREIVRRKLGSQMIDLLQYQWSWAIITRVGAARPIVEGLMPNGLVVLDRILSFPLE